MSCSKYFFWWAGIALELICLVLNQSWNILAYVGIRMWISGVGCDHSAICATTTVLTFVSWLFSKLWETKEEEKHFFDRRKKLDFDSQDDLWQDGRRSKLTTFVQIVVWRGESKKRKERKLRKIETILRVWEWKMQSHFVGSERE
jgi:hypothetical protein